MLSENEFGRVVNLVIGRGFRHRISSMGFASGTVVRMIKKTGIGPIIVEIGGSSRIAIGWGEASKIMVEIIGGK